MKAKFFALTVLFLCVECASSESTEYYVSIDGSDSWDGASAYHIDDTDVGPWKTLNHAIESIRQLRPNPPTAADHVTIFLLPGTHYLTSTLKMNQRESYLTISAFNEVEEVSLSGGLLLDGGWYDEGNGIKTMTFQGSCGEAFVANQRLVPARSPSLTDITPNLNLASPPYNTIKNLLVETETCTRNTTKNTQDCPEEDKLGFIFEDEFSSTWQNLEETRTLIFHSWIAEYAMVGNITEENGVKKVFFTEPLKHAPIGNWAQSGGWRFLIFNNLALLEAPGECVCNDLGEGLSKFSYIPPNGSENLPVIVSQLQWILDMNSANYVRIQGIKLQHSSSGGVDGYNYGSESAVRVITSENFVITDCEFSQIGMIGLYLTDSSNVHITIPVH